MAKGKKKGNKRLGGGDAAQEDEQPQRRLTKRELRALEREAMFADAQKEESAAVSDSASAPNAPGKGKKKGKKGKRGGKVDSEAAAVEEVTDAVAATSLNDDAAGEEDFVMVEEAPKPAAGGFGALNDDESEEEEEADVNEETTAAPKKASGFAALDDDSEDEEEEEEEAAPAPAPKKASGFAALDDSEDDEEEEEEAAPAPAPKKASGFAALDDSEEEEEEEEEAAPAPAPKKASGFAALDDSEEEEEEEEEEAAPVPKKASGFAALNDSEDEEEEQEVQPKKTSFSALADDSDDDATSKKSKKKKAKKEKKEKKKSKKSKDADDEGEEDSDGKKKKKKKLSNKERRKLKAAEEAEERAAAASRIVATDFAVSRTAIKYDEAWANATDINIPQFTISAYGKTLFENAELKIAAGRRYGLVGPNGMGKTTVLKQLANGQLEIPPKIDCLYVEQEVKADDTPAVEMVLAADTKRTALLAREKEILRRMDEEEYSEALQEELKEISLEMAASGAETAEARALAILHGLGFDAQMQQAPTKSFSGGWRMRVSIARALFVQPTLLLLDEPTNHLDLNAVIWLDDYLQKWKNTLLVVSHDQDFLDSVCTDIIHLDQRQLFYYRGNYEMFKSQFEQTRIKQLKAWEKQQQKIRAAKRSGKSSKNAQAEMQKKKSRESGGAKKNKNQQQQSSADDTSSRLLERPKDYEVHFEFPDPTDLAPPIIQVKDIGFNYPNGPTLFKDLSFGIDMESRITIVGPNGVGKSTLLKLMTNELDPTEGEVLINRHLRIARYHQHFVDVLPMNETPVEFLTRVHSSNATYQLARNRLGKFGLPGTAHTIKMMNLSGGQKSRVVFASLSFQEPHIIILDEPTNNLDIESIDALSEAINEFSGGVVLVSHDARLIQSTDMVLWVCENQTVEEMVGGFDAYKNEILTDLAKKEEADRIRLEARMEQKKKEREEKVKRLKEKMKAKAAAAAAAE